MKVLLYSTPFSGNLNVLKKMMDEHKEIDFKLVITGWKNLGVEGAINLARSTLQETDPAVWALPRVNELLADSLEIALEHNPDLIIYDYSSLEGHFTGKLLGIPYWSSIPALIGPNNQPYVAQKIMDERNRKALAQLKTKYGVDASNAELICDGLHFPGQVNLVWSYPELTPSNFMEGRKEGVYCFVGNYNRPLQRCKTAVYFSLGTVVMGTLWDQEETRTAVRKFVAGVAEGLSDVNVVFVTQGKHVLDTYPKYWRIEDRVNQVEMLASSKVFITHGGSNSFHEAVIQRVPMVVVPFFGDQFFVGQRVAELGIGINLGKEMLIDRKPNLFLNSELAERTVDAVKHVLSNSEYQSRMDNLSLTKNNLADIMKKYET